MSSELMEEILEINENDLVEILFKENDLLKAIEK